MNSLGALLLLLGMISMGVNRQKVFKESPYLLLFAIPLAVGAGAALFSESGGLMAVAGFLNRMKFFFLPFVLAAIVKDEKRLKWLWGAVLFSGIFASLVGLADPLQRNYGSFTGMHELGRNADMLMITLLGLFAFLGHGGARARIGKKWVACLVCVAALFFWGMMMSGIRGAWLGFFVGFGVYALFVNRRWLVVGVVLVAIACSMGPGGRVVNEIRSIGNTTSNASNLARFQLWRAGFDFSKNHLVFGSGRDTVREQFKEFYYAQPEAYQHRYKLSIDYPGHFHNSYMQFFVEGGLLFFVTLIACGALLLYRLFRALTLKKEWVDVAFAASIGFLVSQFFHSELYSYGGALLMLALFGGLSGSQWATKGSSLS